MLPKVYVETSVISYLTAWPSTDFRVLAKQAATKEWWATSRERFELFASGLVVDEAGEGDKEAAEERLDVLATIALLDGNLEVDELALALLNRKAVPTVAADDATHIAFAAVHRMDYLVTWNFRHINNVTKFKDIEHVCQSLGYPCPTICTPEHLKESSDEA